MGASPHVPARPLMSPLSYDRFGLGPACTAGAARKGGCHHGGEVFAFGRLVRGSDRYCSRGAYKRCDGLCLQGTGSGQPERQCLFSPGCGGDVEVPGLGRTGGGVHHPDHSCGECPHGGQRGGGERTGQRGCSRLHREYVIGPNGAIEVSLAAGSGATRTTVSGNSSYFIPSASMIGSCHPCHFAEKLTS